MDALDAIADIEDTTYVKASMKFRNPDWLVMFTRMGDSRKKCWLTPEWRTMFIRMGDSRKKCWLNLPDCVLCN